MYHGFKSRFFLNLDLLIKMNTFSLYKTEKFLENSNSFMFVTFQANKQKTLVSFKEILRTNKLSIKFIKSKALAPFLKTYLNSKALFYLSNIARGPIYVIQNINRHESLLDNISNITLEDFLKKKMQVLICFFRGQLYTPKIVFSLDKEKLYLQFLESFHIRNFNLVINFKISEMFLVKLLYIHLSENAKTL